MIDFVVVVLEDGKEWRRRSALDSGKSEFAKITHQLLEEYRNENPDKEVFDRIIVRFDKATRNA